MDEFSRDPCPWRILDDAGGAFALGAIGGSAYHGLIMGLWKGPRGSKINHSLSLIRHRAPLTAGAFASWGATFSMCDCTLAAVRRKEDFWNSIISGGATGVILAARQGVGPMIGSGIAGAFLLGLIEGIGVLINHAMAPQFKQVDPITQQEQMRDMYNPDGTLNPSFNPPDSKFKKWFEWANPVQSGAPGTSPNSQ